MTREECKQNSWYAGSIKIKLLLDRFGEKFHQTETCLAQPPRFSQLHVRPGRRSAILSLWTWVYLRGCTWGVITLLIGFGQLLPSLHIFQFLYFPHKSFPYAQPSSQPANIRGVRSQQSLSWLNLNILRNHQQYQDPLMCIPASQLN